MTEVVTDTGLAAVVSSLIGGDINWLGWGSGSGQGVTDTDLDAALPEARSQGAGAAQTTTVAGDTYRVTGSILATGSRTVSEVGVFNDSTGSNLAFYGDFNPLSLGVGDSVHFTVDVLVERA